MAQRRGIRYDAAREARALQFATALADALHELHITHKELAQELGVTIYAVDYWTRGANPSMPGAANIDKLCALLEARIPGAGTALAKTAAHAWQPQESAQSPTSDRLESSSPTSGDSPTPTNLPHQLSSFVGREREIGEVRDLLAGVRLLTLTGAGGIGKTRLAITVAAASANLFPDGVWLVELAPLSASAPSPVAKATAYVLGVRDESRRSTTEKLVEHLNKKRVMLVLDNCEHLVEECATLVLQLLQSCRGLTVMTTSREALRLEGEALWRVPPLTLPEQGLQETPTGLLRHEAIRLFVERATSSLSTFRFTEENAASVAHICTQLDGVPLAIELAAACVSFLTIEQIEARLSDQFRLLSTRNRTVLPRHKTLQAAIEWSYNLLSGEEQALFRRLSVFVGTWSLEGGEAVCSGGIVTVQDVAPMLRALEDKSLINAEIRGREARYSMLQTIREYAALRLQDAQERGEGEETENADALRARHAEYYACLAERAEGQFLSQQQPDWIVRLEAERSNIMAAVSGCEERGDIETGLRLAAPLLHFWLLRGYLNESREHLQALLQSPYPAPASEREKRIRGNAYNALGGITQTQGDYAVAGVYYAEGLALRREVGDKRLIAGSLNNLGNVAWLQGDYESAHQLYTESLAFRRELGDKSGMSMSLNNLGLVTWYSGDPIAARALHKEALALYLEIGDTWGASTSMNDLGNLAWFEEGDSQAARTLYKQSLAIRRQLNNKGGVATSLSDLARVACAEGQYEEARTLWSESLRLCWEIGEKRTLISCLMGLAWACGGEAGAGDEAGDEAEVGVRPDRAARLLGAADALAGTTGFELRRVDAAEYEHTAGRIRAALGDLNYDVAWGQGHAMPLEQAIKLALDEEG